MELRHLRYFVVAAEEENFHRAANRLHVAQPALSRRIRDLETELEVQLFERHRKRVRLSAAGRSYLEDARRMLEALELAGSRARSVGSGEIGSLTLGLRDTLMRNPLVARAIHEFITKHRDITLKLEQETHPAMANAVVEGAVDAAFLYSRPPDNPLLEHVELASDTFIVALPADHPLAKRRSIRMSDLKDERFLWIRREMAPYIHDRVIAACQASGFTPHIVHYGANEITRLQLVAVGMGITFVHASTNNPLHGVVTRRIADLDVSVSLDLAWHRDKHSPALERLIQIVRGLRTATPLRAALRKKGR